MKAPFPYNLLGAKVIIIWLRIQSFQACLLDQEAYREIRVIMFSTIKCNTRRHQHSIQYKKTSQSKA